MEKSGGRKGRPRIEVDMREAVELRAQGLSVARVAARVGVHEGTLRSRFKEIEGMPLSALSRGSVLVDDGSARDV